MKVRGKSIRTLSKVIKAVGGKTNIHLAVNINDVDNDKISQLGFDIPPTVGDYLIPSVVGKFTYFNVNGREEIRKDLPKESKSIMCFGTTRDWHGGLHSGIQIRTIKKYPRDYIPAPSETFQIIVIEGKQYIASQELKLNAPDDFRNIHVCNLMLECFSQFELFDSDSNKIIGPKLKRMQWDILPKGEYPWKKSRPFIEAVTNNIDRNDKAVIEHRMNIISRRNPDFLATGRGGFSGYFVYGFESKRKYVLESIQLDNATYVFDCDWEKVSRLTKNQIINSDIAHQRIIHNRKWAASVGKAIDGK